MKSQETLEWEKIAEKVLAGEYDRADKSTKQSVMMGLNAIGTPKAREAWTRLDKLKGGK